MLLFSHIAKILLKILHVYDKILCIDENYQSWINIRIKGVFKMQISFLGAAHEVTGSCTLLTIGSHKILIDCGMEQGPDTYENCDIPISTSEIDCVLLTHAHIDHSGKIPLLVSKGYSGPIYATSLTTKLCDIMLEDSAHIQEMEYTWRSRKSQRSGKNCYEPLYSIQDAKNSMKLFVSCDYNQTYDIFSDVKIKFIDAGHLLGSSSIEITVFENNEEKTILFSGDIGNVNRPLLKNPHKPEKADYVIVESTYGDRVHQRREDYVKQLTDVIQETLDRSGNVVIPSFAVGRTQEMLYLLRIIKEKNLIKNHGNFPVWLDSPLAIEATEIYSKDVENYCDEQTLEFVKKGINVLKFPGLKIALTAQESKEINFDETPKVIISASGMCEAGRIRHHLKHNLWRSECTILFVGYQAEGTLGRLLIDGATSTKLFGEKIQVAAQIETMSGVSAHADKLLLLDWLQNIKVPPKMVFVNHGHDFVCDKFAQTISEQLSLKAVAPYNGAVYDLDTCECLYIGNTQRLIKSPKKQNKNSEMFKKLLNAEERLASVINRNKGFANKDLAKFADQINALCEKWSK